MSCDLFPAFAGSIFGSLLNPPNPGSDVLVMHGWTAAVLPSLHGTQKMTLDLTLGNTGKAVQNQPWPLAALALPSPTARGLRASQYLGRAQPCPPRIFKHRSWYATLEGQGTGSRE